MEGYRFAISLVFCRGVVASQSIDAPPTRGRWKRLPATAPALGLKEPKTTPKETIEQVSSRYQMHG